MLSVLIKILKKRGLTAVWKRVWGRGRRLEAEGNAAAVRVEPRLSSILAPSP